MNEEDSLFTISTMKNEIKNYGFVPDEIKPEDYVLGGFGSLPKDILQADGDWTPYLPVYEAQSNKNFDSYGCTCFATLNIIETLLKKIHGQEYNFSERYIYNIIGIRPPGTSPHTVAECIRKNGVISQELLPFTDTYEEFITPDPMTAKYLVEGQKWAYELKHEWLWTTPLAKEDRLAKIKEALLYSPIGVSVTAWYKQGEVYVDKGQPNSHWTLIYGIADNGYKVFDSYDHSHKILSFDHNIQFAKRYYLAPKVKRSNWVIDLLKRLLKIFI